MSVQNPQLVGFLLSGNRSNFLYVEGSTAWLYDCPHFLSPLCKADRCFDRLPIHFKDTLMYVDPITRQTYDYATPIACENNPRNIIELDPDSDDQDFYILGPDPIIALDPNSNHYYVLITELLKKMTLHNYLNQNKLNLLLAQIPSLLEKQAFVPKRYSKLLRPQIKH